MAKKFFYVCAGLLLLAVAAALGVHVVGAQGSGTLSIGHINNLSGDGVVGVVNRVLVRGNFNPFRVNNVTPPVPGDSPIVAVDEGHAMLASGDVYEIQAGGWVLLGNMLTNVNSVESGAAEMGLTVAPNPAGKTLSARFSLSKAARVRVRLLDVQGRIVEEVGPLNMSAGQQAVSLDLSGLRAAGSYFVQVDVDGRVVSRQSAILR